MAFGKRNEVKIDPLRYNICILGEAKIGKTSTVKEFVEKLGGEDSYIFLEMAGEAGADAIDGIVYEDVDNFEYLTEIIEDIEDNKTTEYPNLRVVVIDTYDGLIKITEQEAIRLWNKAHPDKKADTIDVSWNGFQKGQSRVFDMMFDIITRLRKVGVATIVIGHVKTRDQLDVASNTSFSTLTSDVEKIYFNLLKKKMHFLGLAYYDRTIITEKTGRKNAVTKKDITVNKIVEESRKIKWRDDNYALDSGCRFAEIEPEIPLDADAMIKSITDAIIAEASKNKKSIDQLRKEQDAERAKREVEIAKEEVERASKKELDAIITQIKEYFVQKKDAKELESLKPIARVAKELGYDSPIAVDNIEDAKKILEMCV